MLGIFRRKRSRLKAKDYLGAAKEVLLADGFKPDWLEDLLPHPDGLKIERLFTMLQKRGLDPSEAAKAIEIATHFYNEKKAAAQESGWPLQYTDKIPPEYTEEECFYLEQMVDSASAVIKKRKKPRWASD